MKVIYIIGIILILTLPPISTGYSSQVLTGPANHAEDYNFTRLQPGAFPVNNSWIGFSTINMSSYSTAGIEEAAGGYGLTTSTFSYGSSTPSYLDISMRSNQSFRLKITFSWNYNNSLFYTGDQIILRNNNSKMIQYNLGPDYGNVLKISGNSNYTIGSQPSPSEVYTLDLYGNISSSKIYTNIVKGWNNTMHLPYILDTSSRYTGSGINIEIGGGFSNLTVYNVYLSNETTGFRIPQMKEWNNYGVTNISLPASLQVGSNSSIMPVVDWMDNSILYISNESTTSLRSYNFYNSTASTLYTFPVGTEGIVSAGDSVSAFFLLQDSGKYLLATVNYTTGKVALVAVNSTLSTQTFLIPDGPSVYIVNSNGSVTFVYRNSAVQTESTLSPPVSGELLSGGLSGSGISLVFMNATTGLISVLDYSSDGTVTKVTEYHAGLFDSTSPYQTANSPEPFTWFEINSSLKFPGTVEFIGNSSVPYVTDHNFSYLPSSGQYLALKDKGSVYLLSGSSLLKTPLSSNLEFVSFDSDLSHGMAITNGVATLYYTGGTPLSSSNISVSLQAITVVSGNASIRYSVNSNLAYILNASFGNMTLFPKSDYLNFSTRNIANGTYNLTLNATNIAGYCSETFQLVSVDNLVSTILLDPGNNSTVLQNSTIGVEVLGLDGPVLTSVSFDRNNSYVYSGNTFNVTVPDKSGNFTLSLTTTDQYGVSRYYHYFYQVVALGHISGKTDVSPYSFLRTGNFNLSWSRTDFSSGYNVTISSSRTRYSYNVTENYTRVDLPSGAYSLVISATLLNSSKISVVQENFTVQDFNPLLTVNRTEGSYFSFSGNSANSSLYVKAYSNVSGTFWINVSRNGTPESEQSGKGSFFSDVLNGSSTFFRQNGLYTVNITDQEMSGREVYTSFSILVNNTIPIAPLRENRLYYNITDATLPLVDQKNVTYQFTYPNNSSKISLPEGDPVVKLHSTVTDIIVYAVSKWGNFNSSAVQIVYFSGKPEINLNLSETTLIWNNTVTVGYSISDPVNLTGVSLNVNNITLNLSSGTKGTIGYRLSNDGYYNISMSVSDICGNSNTTQPITVVCDYYPKIVSIGQEIGMLMGIAHVSSILTGNHLQSVNLSWKIDGRSVSRSSGFWTLLMPGSHNITLTASAHGVSVVSTRTVFTFGMVPEIITGLLVVLYFSYRNYSGSRNVTRAREFIIRNSGKRRSEIYALSRKEKINRKTVTEVIQNMVSEEIVVLAPDPDGNLFILKLDDRD